MNNNYFEEKDIRENKIPAGFGYFGFPCFLIPMLMKHSKFARFHANQAIISFIFNAIGVIVLWVGELFVLTTPAIGFLFVIVALIFELCLFIFVIINIVSAFKGKARRIPIIGKITILSGSNNVELKQESKLEQVIAENMKKETCPNCGATVGRGKKFCGSCGEKMPEIQKEEKITCSKCNAEFVKGTKFCPECGEKVNEEVKKNNICDNCKTEVEQDVKFCPECGKKIGE